MSFRFFDFPPHQRVPAEVIGSRVFAELPFYLYRVGYARFVIKIDQEQNEYDRFDDAVHVRGERCHGKADLPESDLNEFICRASGKNGDLFVGEPDDEIGKEQR